MNSMVYSTAPNKTNFISSLQSKYSPKRFTTQVFSPIQPVTKTARGRFGQKSIRSLSHPLKSMLSSTPPQTIGRQQKVIRQVIAVQPAIPQQHGRVVQATKAADSLNTKSSVCNAHQHPCSIPKKPIEPQKIMQHSIIELEKKPAFSLLLHQLASVVQRKENVKKPIIQAVNPKLGKCPSPIARQKSRTCFQKTSATQLSLQTKTIGKVKKPTAPNVQQRQFIQQTKKYIDTCPEELKFARKSKALVIQQNSAPIISSPHAGQNRSPLSQICPKNVDSEDELRCPICTEMFIEAVTLSCSHTYCKYCIGQWKKNRPFCPICNTKISKEYPTRVIDNYIQKNFEKASREVKEHRRSLREQRLSASRINQKKRITEFPIGTATSKRFFS